MSDVLRNIKARLEAMRKSWAWLARQLEVSDQVVTNWKTRGVPAGRYLDVAKALGLSVEALTSAPPIPGINEPMASYDTLEYAGPIRTTARVPIVGTAKLGDNGYYYELDSPTGHGDGYVEAFSADRNAYAVRVRGDSMHPTIKHGQIVVVEPNGALVPGENVLIALRDGRKMIKELVTGRPDSVTVVSVNGGERMTFERDEIESIHAVAMVVSASKWKPD